MAKITEGPWVMGEMNDSGAVMILGGESKRYVCTVQIQQIGGGAISYIMEDTRMANARLIAAAPKLLEACKAAEVNLLYLLTRAEATNWLPEDIHSKVNDCHIRVKQAIAEAEGIQMNLRRTLLRATELQARWLRWSVRLASAIFYGCMATAGQL